jgi:hypothetical protein
VRVGGDEGRPVMAWDGEAPIKKAFRDVCEKIAAAVSVKNAKSAQRRVLPITRS